MFCAKRAVRCVRQVWAVGVLFLRFAWEQRRDRWSTAPKRWASRSPPTPCAAIRIPTKKCDGTSINFVMDLPIKDALLYSHVSESVSRICGSVQPALNCDLQSSVTTRISSFLLRLGVCCLPDSLFITLQVTLHFLISISEKIPDKVSNNNANDRQTNFTVKLLYYSISRSYSRWKMNADTFSWSQKHKIKK